MNGGGEAVTVRVPGSTSNCGAGFDSLGLALTIYNRVTLTRGGDGAGGVSGARGVGGERAVESAVVEPEREADARAKELATGAAAAFFAATGVRAERFRFRIEGEIPLARGLGSSATVIVGVLAGLDALHATGLTRKRLVEIGTALEGNPENIASGVLGGFTVSRTDPETGAYVDSVRVAVSDELSFVVVSPALEMPTKAARAVLPATLSYFEAVKSINSAAYLAAVFARGEFEKLRDAVRDFVHEPFRLPGIPGASAAIAAGIEAGALTGWLSGSGSSVVCVCRAATGEAVTTAMTAMTAAFARANVESRARVLRVDNDGLSVAKRFG